MARRPQSREADNRARSGRQGRRTAVKQSTARQVADFVFDNPLKNLQRAVQSSPPIAGVSGLIRAGQKGRSKGGYKGGVIETAKQAGKEIAWQLASAGAGKAGGRAVTAARATGIPARIVNKATRQQILVHGTPNRIQGGYLRPTAGSPGSPNEAVVFGHNPNYRGSRQSVPPYAREYGASSSGSAVIAKVPKRNLKKIKYEKDNPGMVNTMAGRGNPMDPKNPPWVMSTKPAKVVSQVPVSSKNFDRELAQKLREAGAPLRSPRTNPVGRVKQKVQTRRSNSKSVV